jgi:glycosyltransferase involved in cell wall biosynthesis
MLDLHRQRSRSRRRFGLMLRHLGRQPGGTGTYTNMMVSTMLSIDPGNEYVLLYDDPARLGSYARFPNATEVACRAPSKLLWDQLVVPWVARRHKLDAIFNLKMTVPLLAPCPTAMVQHGADWFVMPEQYPFMDRLYVRLFARLYWRRASRIVSVSDDSKERLARLMNAKSAAKLVTIFHGVDTKFTRQPDSQSLAELRNRYSLRAPFVLYLGQIYPMKNVGGLIRAFARMKHRVPHDLVIVGKPDSSSAAELALINELGLGNRVSVVGWVPDEDVPTFFHAADAFAFPSLYEGFGIPIIEAMAARCPVVTSTAGACPEVAGDAAILVDPRDPDAIAAGILQVLTDTRLRETLRQRGSARAQEFTWEKSARQTIRMLESLVPAKQPDLNETRSASVEP